MFGINLANQCQWPPRTGMLCSCTCATNGGFHARIITDHGDPGKEKTERLCTIWSRVFRPPIPVGLHHDFFKNLFILEQILCERARRTAGFAGPVALRRASR